MIFKVYDNLKPGAWAEFHETVPEMVGIDAKADAELHACALGEWNTRLAAGGTAIKRDFMSPKHYKQWMIEAGFQDVVEEPFYAPVNAWPLDPHDRAIGNWVCMDLLRLVPATTKLMLASGMAVEQIPTFQEEVCECVTRKSMRVYSMSK